MSDYTERLDNLKKILINEPPSDHLNEIIDNCYLGDLEIATNKEELKRYGINNVLNSAFGKGTGQINSDQTFYEEIGVKFFGILATIDKNCNIEDVFNLAADFIHKSIAKPNGKVLVHCNKGLSRSATLVLAYLIKHRQMTVEESLKLVVSKRPVNPNQEFLLRLFEYEKKCRN